jgi:hypothetical protein
MGIENHRTVGQHLKKYSGDNSVLHDFILCQSALSGVEGLPRPKGAPLGLACAARILRSKAK